MTTIRILIIITLTRVLAFGQKDDFDKLEKSLKKVNYSIVCELSNKIISIDSSSSKINFYYGLCERKNGNYESAFRHLNKSISIDDKNSNAFAELGNVYAMTGDYNNALRYYNHALEIDNANTYAYNSKGALYYQFLNNDSLAILNYAMALSLDKNNILVIYNIGAFLKYKERYAEAIQYFNKALKLNNELFKAYEARAVCYYYLNKNKKAIRGFKKALKYNTTKDPFDKLDNNDLYKWLSKCYYELGKSKKANYYTRLATEIMRD